MKRSLVYLLSTLLFLFFAAISCKQADKAKAEEGSETTEEKMEEKESADETDEMIAGWETQKEKYHDLMADVFHSAEEGDLEPLRKKYKDLATVASQWATMPLPDKYREKGLEDMLVKLARGSKDLMMVVPNGTDEELTKAITDLHDVYHDVVGACED